MAVSLNQKNPSAVPQKCSGWISGTYTAASDDADDYHGAELLNGVLTITPGFVPKYVKVINVTDRLTQEWFEGMNTGDFLETAANGDKTLETDDKLSVSSSGVVTILANGGAITDNDTVVWVIEG